MGCQNEEQQLRELTAQTTHLRALICIQSETADDIDCFLIKLFFMTKFDKIRKKVKSFHVEI